MKEFAKVIFAFLGTVAIGAFSPVFFMGPFVSSAIERNHADFLIRLLFSISLLFCIGWAMWFCQPWQVYKNEKAWEKLIS